ncbi:isopentenyl-diphosphate delta-isomerase [Parcubacteria bacterium DG_74_3]|nr:MAG: isopentenyl-diphosphate delta-isomerase [Parcubacteria bacterium DG_74_3]
MTKVILVDERDKEIGVEEKLKAHIEGKLHRCFSIFVFNSQGELLLQKRTKTKYHSGGLWSNTCCSHPEPNRNLKEEAKRRLKEEMGIDCDLKEVFSFIYQAKVKAKKGYLTEYEFDHVFVGKFDGNPKINPEEAEDWKWEKPDKTKKDIEENPEKYTSWFKMIFERVLKTQPKY